MMGAFLSTPMDLSALVLAGCVVLLLGLVIVLITRRHLMRRFSQTSLQVYEERLRIEETLRTLQMAVDQSPNPVIITDIEGCIEYVNQAFEATFGYGRGECLGRNPRILASGKTPFQTYDELWDALRAGMPWKGKLFDIAKDGKECVIFSHISPVRGPAGNITHFLGIQEDITEHQRIAMELDQHRDHLEELVASRTAALREAELKYRTVADFTYTWETWVDVDGRWLYCSPACERITGYRVEEFISNPGLFLDITYPDDREFVQQHHKIFRNNNHSHEELAFRMIRRDGQVRWIEHVCQPVFDEGGGYLGRRASNRDITARKQTEAALARAQETTALANWRLSETLGAMDQLGIAIHWMDAEGRFRYVNQAACILLGYSEEELLTMAVSDIDPLISQEHFREVAASLQKNKNNRFEARHRTKDGRLVPVEVTLHIQQTNESEHAIAFVTDITRRKEAELGLAEAKARAEAANRAKSQFLANMSHEIRTPIHAILGFTQLLLRKGGDAELHDKLLKIAGSTRHLQSIIDDILDLSKIEAGRMVLEIEDFSPGEVIARVTGLVTARAQEKGIGLAVDYGDLPRRVKGDPTRLTQALLNYLSNAVKFTEQGIIQVTARVEEKTENDLLIRFTVADTGIGIAADHLSCLFQPFEQADGSMTRKYGGTGLGLSITRRIAELMGGDAGVESTVRQGSRFWFTVRLGQTIELGEVVREGGMASNAWTILRRDHAGAWLLLAEDNLLAQEVSFDLLRSAGFRVDVANNGTEAVKWAGANAYDLILMDVQMPEQDGLEATRTIRCLPGHEKTPILAMTANAFYENRARCLEVGMDDFIAKPVDPDLLFETLLKWLLPRSVCTAQPAAEPFQLPAQDLPTELTDPVSELDKGADTTLLNRLQAFLMTMPGIDAALGMNNVRSDAVGYIHFLCKYDNLHADDSAQLRVSLAQGDENKARCLAHSLKGISGTLGITQVHEAAGALENALRGGEASATIEHLIAALDSEQRSVSTTIKALSELSTF
ncbi:two-component system, sensor histidine kinase [Gammaproteobacteria bacterium]